VVLVTLSFNVKNVGSEPYTRRRSHLFSHVAGLLEVGHGTSALLKNSALAVNRNKKCSDFGKK
jgi:hypothetical protein